MSNIKPNTFPLKLSLDGSEEIYTQTNDINEKFTLNQVSTYITQNIDTWLYKEVYMTGADLDALPTTKFELLSENDLSGTEYYEVNRIIIESIIDEDNIVPHFNRGYVLLNFKTSPSVVFGNTFPDNSYFMQIPQSLIACTENLVYCLYSPAAHEQYVRVTGLYADSDIATGGGTSIFKIKIYYKIKS
jgi:hypothetical protein